MNKEVSDLDALKPRLRSLVLNLEYQALGTCTKSEAWTHLQNLMVVAYRPLLLEHHAKTHSAHLIASNSIP
jgi:hypothetical protein